MHECCPVRTSFSDELICFEQLLGLKQGVHYESNKKSSHENIYISNLAAETIISVLSASGVGLDGKC